MSQLVDFARGTGSLWREKVSKFPGYYNTLQLGS